MHGKSPNVDKSFTFDIKSSLYFRREVHTFDKMFFVRTPPSMSELVREMEELSRKDALIRYYKPKLWNFWSRSDCDISSLYVPA